MTAKDPLIGTRIGNCLVQRRIGAGGMGTVYLAHHVGLDKSVAIKVLSRELMGSEENIERFKREAKTAARLEHPNIVQVFDVGEHEGWYYLAMQFVEGKPLDKIIEERGKLPLAQALGVVRRIATALAAAHKAGVIHRDIKPANVLISKEGVVKVVDFGLARSVESGATISSEGQIVGTPHYMAPEQAQGQKVDARTDIYALGATLYHLVTGARCFNGPSPVSILIKQVQEMPPPPHEVNPELSPAVTEVIFSMMSKDPARRPQTAEEVIKALDTLQPAVKSIVAQVRPAEMPKRWVWAGAALGALLVVTIAGLAMRGKPKDRTSQVAAPPATTAAMPPPASTQTTAPPPPATTKEEPPKETGMVRGVNEWMARYKDKPDEQKNLGEVLKRSEAFMIAVGGRDEQAIRGFLPRKPSVHAMVPKWQEMTDRFVAELLDKKRDGRLDHATITNVEMSTTPFGQPRVEVTTQVTIAEKAGGSRTSPPSDMAWVRELGGTWVVALDQKRRPK